MAYSLKRCASRLAPAALVAAAILVRPPAIAAAEDIPVDLELVLAVDISASIDRDEIGLQHAGYVAALRNPEVVAAMLGGVLGRVAITYVEWSDFRRTLVGWTLIDSADAATAFAASVTARPALRGETTVIDAAIDYAASLFDGNGFAGTRRFIDISSDGRDTYDPLDEKVPAARDRALARGITINGLAINPDREFIVVEGAPEPLDRYFHENIVGGPGAFVVVAETPSDFPRAVLRKLIREIAAVAPPPRG
ncbi:MAG: DUF1194 domain-containing protein [Alphaproteobacteria bacterium]